MLKRGVNNPIIGSCSSRRGAEPYRVPHLTLLSNIKKMKSIDAPRQDLSPQLETKVLESWSDLDLLKAEWNELLTKSRSDTIFLTWEWINSWAKVNKKSLKPVVIVVRNRLGELLAIAPFYQTQYRLLKLIPYRILRIMGDYPTGAEYPGWIVHRDHERVATQNIVKTLHRIRRRWDCIWMPNVATWNGIHEIIMQACRDEKFHLQIRPVSFGYFNLPEKVDEYITGLSRKKRSEIHNQHNKIMRRKDVVVDYCKTPDELPGYLDALFNLHHARWQLKGDDGTFLRKPDEASFYREFLPLGLDKGWLRFFALKEGNEFKAVQIGYVYNNIFHSIQEGFDPDYVPGAGNVLRFEVIKHCISEGVAGYDFLGDMTEHKRRWSAKERQGSDLFIGRSIAKNHFLFTIGFWPTGTYLEQIVAGCIC